MLVESWSSFFTWPTDIHHTLEYQTQRKVGDGLDRSLKRKLTFCITQSQMAVLLRNHHNAAPRIPCRVWLVPWNCLKPGLPRQKLSWGCVPRKPRWIKARSRAPASLLRKQPCAIVIFTRLYFWSLQPFDIAYFPNMLFAFLILSGLAFGQNPPPKQAIGFTNQAFNAWGLNIDIDGSCVVLDST